MTRSQRKWCDRKGGHSLGVFASGTRWKGVSLRRPREEERLDHLFDAKSGSVLPEGNLAKAPSASYASPILVGNKRCCAREDGTVISAEVKEDGVGKIVKNKMSEAIIASPIVVNNSLIVRSDKHLWCFR